MSAITWKSILLFGSVFFAGILVRGEIARRQDLKRELDDIRTQQQKTMALVDSVNANYTMKKLEFLEMNKKLYAQLDTILDLKIVNSQRLKQAEERLKVERIRLDADIQDLKDVVREQGIQ
ncbi:MAG TPA: hypothetical protein PK228_12115 [Saprospiraceae bacterium]|nr:hypothetical protein [Saprospiraceae bacterium]